MLVMIAGASVLAIGALFEAQRRGWKVPGRIAIAGYDDLEIVQHTVPRLTCLRLPRLDIGRRSAEALLQEALGALEDFLITHTATTADEHRDPARSFHDLVVKADVVGGVCFDDVST